MIPQLGYRQEFGEEEAYGVVVVVVENSADFRCDLFVAILAGRQSARTWVALEKREVRMGRVIAHTYTYA